MKQGDGCRREQAAKKHLNSLRGLHSADGAEIERFFIVTARDAGERSGLKDGLEVTKADGVCSALLGDAEEVIYGIDELCR